MLFIIQAYLEDFLKKRNIIDSDGYAVHVANIYFHHRSDMDETAFLRKVRGIKTVIFVNNGIKNRAEFEKSLIDRLDRQFKKKLINHNPTFPGGTEPERKRLQHLPRRTVGTLLKEFKHAVEARAIDMFWISRTKGKLRSSPEKIAQGLLAVFTKGVLKGQGIILREINSGIGFVDIGIIFSTILHLVEVKVLTGKFEGPEQLEQYMRTERRNQGSLVVIDTLNPENKIDLPELIPTLSGIIKVYRVDINPCPPSKLIYRPVKKRS